MGPIDYEVYRYYFVICFELYSTAIRPIKVIRHLGFPGGRVVHAEEITPPHLQPICLGNRRALADLEGARAGRAPYGSRLFRFDMQNFRNIATSGVHGPPYEVHAPLREILDPPL